METGVTIPKRQASKNAQDFEFLKESAIGLLQRLSGKVWTDYNVHDPGVTMLEILCYAVTELGYCIDFPVPDLLASRVKDTNINSTFFAPDQILYSAPLTGKDYNRLFLDLDEISVARMVPARSAPDFKGLFDLEVQLAKGADPVSVRKKILSLYHSNQLELSVGKDDHRMLKSNRNLCEDLAEIRFLGQTPIRFGISLQVQDGIAIQELIAGIVKELSEYLSPPIRFYRYQQLLKEGMYMEDILNGPHLAYGVIPESALNNLSLTEEIRTSDLMQLIAVLPGIKEIQHIEIKDRFNTQHAWVCKVEKGKVPFLDLEGSQIALYNRAGALVYQDNLSHQKEAMQDLAQLRTTQKAEDFQPPTGRFYNREIPRSLQNEFPRIYGIGDTGLPARSGNLRKGQAKQLQGFLLLFEQTLANLFSQIANLNKLFSIDPTDQTKYYQGLLNIPGVQHLYQPFINQYIQRHIDLSDGKRLSVEWDIFKSGFIEWKKFQKNHGAPCSDRKGVDELWQSFSQTRLSTLYLDAIRELDNTLYSAIETRAGYVRRRNEVLDHLLARFAVDAMDYNFAGYLKQLPDQQMKGKLAMLNNLPYMSRARGTGMDLGANNPTASTAKTESGVELLPEKNLSGLEEYLQMLFNIPKRPLNHLAEHTASDFLVGDEKPNASSLENFMDIQFLNTNPDRAVQQLFEYGLNRSNYHFAKGKYQLMGPDGKVVALFNPPIRDKGRFLKVTKSKLIEQVIQAGADMECLYVVEHLMLRPLKTSPNFGFAIHSPRSDKLLFAASKYWTWAERERVLLEVLEKGRKSENYRIAKIGHRQFKVGLEGTDYLLLGPLFIETEEKTQETIKEYARDFQKLFTENIGGMSEAEKLFRIKEEGSLKVHSDGSQSLVNLFEAGFDMENYGLWEEEGGMFARIIHPETKTIFQSFQRIEGETKEEIIELVQYFNQYSQSYLKNHYLQNVYQHPQLKFRTSRFELYDSLSDPYSHVLTVVVPDWPPRFQNDFFRSSLQKAIFREAPAHLVVNVRRLPYSRMAQFEEKYHKFLVARREWKNRVFRRDASLESADRAPDQVAEQVLDRVLDRSVVALEKEVSLLGDQLLELITFYG